MANIRVDVDYTLKDGCEVSFTAPCNCSDITGLKVYHQGGTKVFTFKDAHGNALTGLGNLFSKGAYVKAILDVTGGSAYLQNADTNAYLEAQFASKAPAGFGLGAFDETNAITKEELDNPTGNGWRYINTVEGSLDWLPTKVWGIVEIVGLNSMWCRETVYDWNIGQILTRTKYGTGGWGPLEWVNPPMVLGVEYSTTERYDRKTVYAKAVLFDTLPENTFKSVWVANGITALVRVEGYCQHTDGDMTRLENNSLISSIKIIGGASLRIDAGANASEWSCTPIVYYTKD